MNSPRRARKKAATRQALMTAARRLFLERGFDSVTVAEVAEAADVAVSTVFAHFPGGKEALVLGDAAEREAALVTAVRDRPGTVLEALHDFLATRGPFRAAPDPVTRMVVATPALRAYARVLWTRCETALAEVIATETGEDGLSARLLARYVLEIPDLAAVEPEPAAALAAAFAHLRLGWPDLP
ncbi:TetR/AcrR family transcriptional regulator [Kibdelosporangium lantanae]